MIDEVVYMLFIIGKTLSVMEKVIPGIYVKKAPPLPPRGVSNRYAAFNREEHITQNSIQRGVSIRYWAFIGSWVFTTSFTVSDGGRVCIAAVPPETGEI